MKEDQLPDCYVEANDKHYVCYVIEYDDYENLDITERYVKVIDGYDIVEVEKKCLICGQTDIYYPV